MKSANKMCVFYSETPVIQHLDHTEYLYNVAIVIILTSLFCVIYTTLVIQQPHLINTRDL